MTEFEIRLKELSNQAEIDLTEEMISRFSLYASLLKEWNEKMNLTAITDDEGIAVKHFIDSLYLLKLVDIKEGNSLVDVGTGAGFPGVPLLIARPDLKVCLMDSTAKRLKFLETVLTELKLTADTVHIRAEEAGQNKTFRESFDIATARAVAPLHILSEYCLPLVKKGGVFLSLKGKPESDEIERGEKAIKVLGGEKAQIMEYELINGDKRTLIITKNIANPAKISPPICQTRQKTIGIIRFSGEEIVFPDRFPFFFHLFCGNLISEKDDKKRRGFDMLKSGQKLKSGGQIVLIPHELIYPNPNQPRKHFDYDELEGLRSP